MSVKTFILTSAIALTFGACSTYEAIPYDRGISNVESIAITNDAMDEKPTIFMGATVGSNFGLIGGLIDAGIASDRAGKVRDMLADADVDLENMLEESLAAQLTEMGYTTEQLEGTRERYKLMKDYDDLAGSSDAYLDVVATSYGFTAPGLGDLWRPSAVFTARLVDSESGDILMENQITYNPLNYSGKQAEGGAIFLTPNPDYGFEKFDDIEANPELAVEAMVDMMGTISETIVKLLD